jgi:hypothetical protein
MADVSLITISLSPPHPESGMVPTVVRMTGQDKFNFDLAAQQLGMSRAVLMRVLLVKGAERILNELGVKAQYEQNEHIDLGKGEPLFNEKTRD